MTVAQSKEPVARVFSTEGHRFRFGEFEHGNLVK